MWMNQSEVEFLHSQRHACPNFRKGIGLLYRLMLAVNAQSDGWAYWRAPGKAAEPLMQLLKERERGVITDAELKKVVTPIKRMVTTQKRVQAKYGNRFEFDVEAVLAENEAGLTQTTGERTMQFRVHVYPVVRVEFVVEAKSFEDAVTKVMEDDKTYEKLRQLEGFAEDYDDTVLVDKLNKKGERIADKDISLESLGL